MAQGRCLGCEETGHKYAECPANKNNLGKQYQGPPPAAKPRARTIHLYNPDENEELEVDPEENESEESKNGLATLT
jgi:hypothetical protein